MVSPQQLLAAVKSALQDTSALTPAQRIELMHAIRSSLPALRSVLAYPGPSASDRAQVQSKEVRLPDSAPITLDDTDVHIALKLSDDLHLNEVECIRLLVSSNKKWGLLGRKSLEIYRLAAGLWYTERKDLITSLYTLLRATILDQGLDTYIITEIQKHLEDLFSSGLRHHLITLIKELNREEPCGWGGPGAEQYVLDCQGSLVLRRDIVLQERLMVCYCLVLSVLIVRMGPKELKDVFATFKDCAAEICDDNRTSELQTIFALTFSLVITFVSDGLSTTTDKASDLSLDASFRSWFSEQVMISTNHPIIEGFFDCIRLSWTVHLMLSHEQISTREAISSTRSSPNMFSFLEIVCENNVFSFLLDKVIQTGAYQNDDEHMLLIYNGYLNKMMVCFLSHPLARDKVKEMKEKAMIALSPYVSSGSKDYQPFVSIMELISEIYRKQPEPLLGNDDIWMFVNFAGEDHTNIHTLVSFLKMLGSLASTEKGAKRVFELLQGKVFRSIGWSTLFDCLAIYDERYKQSLQNSGALLPDFQEGDAYVLVAYLNVLQKVLENGNPAERKKWFPDIEPLFKLLGYENVPTYLKGALRNAIASFIPVSPIFKDTIWTYLEQYDLPVVGSTVGINGHQVSSPVYDLRFELNEVEARGEKYPSTLSFLNLINTLIAEERDVSDKGRRFLGIFRFVYDHVFGSFLQRVYADQAEKWQLAVACLQHFNMILSMYDIDKEDIEAAVNMGQLATTAHASSFGVQIPTIELLRDFMSGKAVFRNIMGILLIGTNTIATERTSQIYGHLLDKVVHLSLEIIILIFEKDLFVAEFWHPLYEPLDVILSQDHNHIAALLEYVRYEYFPQIRLCAIKILRILSSRMSGLVQLLLKSNAAACLIRDYAACLESRFNDGLVVENTKEDVGVLILQLLIENISRPTPNVTHLLLNYNPDSSVEMSILNPKSHYSCLKVILDNLEKHSVADNNAMLYEFGFQLLYELCLDPLTSAPIMKLLCSKKYEFFSKQLDSVVAVRLPKRTTNQSLRISNLHQRAWLLKLLALELLLADASVSGHRDTILAILSKIFYPATVELTKTLNLPHMLVMGGYSGNRPIDKSKVLELLEVVQFRPPSTTLKYKQLFANDKFSCFVDDILKNPVTSNMGGVYYYSERGDRLIDLDTLHEKVLQANLSLNEDEKAELRESLRQLLSWGWKYNKNLEEQAAQLHMLAGWSQIVEVSLSRRMSFLMDHSQILYGLLDASLSSSASPDCSLKMALILNHVALTCMARLRDERFSCPGGVESDSVSCLDMLSVRQLPGGACQSILFKIMMAILRDESSEFLRRRQYALLLSYMQYCQSMLHPDVPSSVLQSLLEDGDDERNLQQIDKEQAELARVNFFILRKEGQTIIDVVTKDAMHGSNAGKPISFYVLDALVNIDEEMYFLNQIQSRRILRSCLTDIATFSYKDGLHSLELLQRLCIIEAQLSLLLRICHKYPKHGAQILLSMGTLEHLASCKAIMETKGNARRYPNLVRQHIGEIDKSQFLVTPVLRLVSCMTSLVDLSDFLEAKSKIVYEIRSFVKENHLAFGEILREDISQSDDTILERINLVVSILSKVWPYEENDEFGFMQELFGIMQFLFRFDFGAACYSQLSGNIENQRSLEIRLFSLCSNLTAYVYHLVKKNHYLQVSDPIDCGETGRFYQPTLSLLLCLLSSARGAVEKAGEEKFLLLNKIQNINELSRKEVDEIIHLCMKQESIMSYDNIRKRRYVAMVEMCRMAGKRDQLINLLLQLTERVLSIFTAHFQECCDSTDLSSLSGNFLPVLEGFEQLQEEKIGCNLKLLHRSVSTLKELATRCMAT